MPALRVRTTMISSRPTVTVFHSPALGSASARSTQFHIVSKICCCSSRKISGSVETSPAGEDKSEEPGSGALRESMIMVILSHTLKVMPVRQVRRRRGEGDCVLNGVCAGQGTSRLGFSPAFDLAHAVHTENADLFAVASVADQEVAVFDGAI